MELPYHDHTIHRHISSIIWSSHITIIQYIVIYHPSYGAPISRSYDTSSYIIHRMELPYHDHTIHRHISSIIWSSHITIIQYIVIYHSSYGAPISRSYNTSSYIIHHMELPYHDHTIHRHISSIIWSSHITIIQYIVIYHPSYGAPISRSYDTSLYIIHHLELPYHNHTIHRHISSIIWSSHIMIIQYIVIYHPSYGAPISRSYDTSSYIIHHMELPYHDHMIHRHISSIIWSSHITIIRYIIIYHPSYGAPISRSYDTSSYIIHHLELPYHDHTIHRHISSIIWSSHITIIRYIVIYHPSYGAPISRSYDTSSYIIHHLELPYHNHTIHHHISSIIWSSHIMIIQYIVIYHPSYGAPISRSYNTSSYIIHHMELPYHDHMIHRHISSIIWSSHITIIRYIIIYHPSYGAPISRSYDTSSYIIHHMELPYHDHTIHRHISSIIWSSHITIIRYIVIYHPSFGAPISRSYDTSSYIIHHFCNIKIASRIKDSWKPSTHCLACYTALSFPIRLVNCQTASTI